MSIEQVAWRTFDGEGGYDYRTYEDNENYAEEWATRNPNHIGWVEPLYTTPQPLTDADIRPHIQRICRYHGILNGVLEADLSVKFAELIGGKK